MMTSTATQAETETTRASRNDHSRLVRGVSQQVLACTQQLLMAYFSSSINAHNEGERAFFEKYGIDRELVAQVEGVSIYRIERACNYNARKLVNNPSAEIGPCMNAMLRALVADLEEEQLVDAFIKAGASNPILAENFGLRACAIKARREALGIVIKTGRRSDRLGKTDMETWHKVSNAYYKLIKTATDTRRVWLQVAEETGESLDLVYRAIKDIVK